MPRRSGASIEATVMPDADRAASRRARDGLAAAVAYGLLTLLLTWPLARSLGRELPADLGDPLLNCWILAWDAEHILRAASGHLGALRGYWNANIFAPHPLALAYSEHLTAEAVMVLPVYAITQNPILTYNVAFLSTFLLSGLGMFLLVRDFTGCSSAAFLAGVAYGFAPYRFGTLSHIQVLSSMWMPFVWLGFHRYFETRRLAALAGAAAAWIAQNLSCGYYLLFFAPVVAIFVAWEVARRRLWNQTRVLIRLASTAVVVAIATAPFVIPYVLLRRLGFSPRSLRETSRFGADVFAYLTTDAHMALWGHVVRAWPRPEGSLFPGFSILALAAIGVAARWWHLRRLPHPPLTPAGAAQARLIGSMLIIACGVLIAILLGWSLHAATLGLELKITSLDRLAILVVGLAAVLLATSAGARATTGRWLASREGMLSVVTLFAFAMSLGPQIHARGKLIEDWSIYSAFRDLVPGFDGLRVPARFAMIVALGLAGLAGQGAAALARRRHGTKAVALFTALVLAESWAVPLPLDENSTEYKQSGLAPLPGNLAAGSATPAVYRFAARLAPSSVLLELPFGEVAFDVRYMFYSTVHWRALVNGYSGGAPGEYSLWTEQLAGAIEAPDAAWRAVLASGATQIVVHEGSYAGDQGRQISDFVRAHGSQELAAFGSDRVFTVRR
jgi:hypothetical protein